MNAENLSAGATRKFQLSKLVQLAAGQLDIAIRAADSDIDALAQAVSRIAGLTDVARRSCDGVGEELRTYAQAAVVAMQFHDQLVQRIEHVRNVLANAATALEKANVAVDGIEAQEFINQICALYSLEDERILFEAIVAGSDGHVRDVVGGDSRRGSIELF